MAKSFKKFKKMSKDELIHQFDTNGKKQMNPLILFLNKFSIKKMKNLKNIKKGIIG